MRPPLMTASATRSQVFILSTQNATAPNAVMFRSHFLPERRFLPVAFNFDFPASALVDAGKVGLAWNAEANVMPIGVGEAARILPPEPDSEPM